MVFKNNYSQVEINKIEVPYGVVVETIKNSNVHIVLNRSNECSTPLDELNTDEKEYVNEKDMRRNYPGRTFIIKTIRYNNVDNKISIVENEEEFDAYIMISKRDIKEQFPELKRGLTIDTEKFGNAIMERVVSNVNSWLKGNTYFVKLIDETKEQVLSPVFADDVKQLKDFIFSNCDDFDDDMFEVIERLTL